MTGQDDSSDGPPRRILSIDGGGLKGTMPAAFLSEVEEQIGQRIVDHFDLIVGTSTGGIIALGLSASEILTFYRQRGPEIFGQSPDTPWHRRLAGRLSRNAKWLVMSKYDPTPLRSALQEVFGNRKLGESLTRLVIPAWDSRRRCPHLFKTTHHSRLEVDYKEKAVDVALATAAGTAYLPAHRLDGGAVLTDGGIWANNPTAVAAVEATALLDWDMSKVRILSLGCTDEHLVIGSNAGVAVGARDGIDVMFQGQSFGALSMARLLLGGGTEGQQRLCRVDVTVPRGFAGMDDASRISDLEGLGRSEARERLPRVRDEFLTAKRPSFQPERCLDREND